MMIIDGLAHPVPSYQEYRYWKKGQCIN